jgi:hypothetical protein
MTVSAAITEGPSAAAAPTDSESQAIPASPSKSNKKHKKHKNKSVLTNRQLPPREVEVGGKSTWFLGIAMILISGFFAAVGFLVSKISSVYEDSKPRIQRVNNIFKRPLTWVGIFTSFLIPAPLDLAALVYARFRYGYRARHALYTCNVCCY